MITAVDPGRPTPRSQATREGVDGVCACGSTLATNPFVAAEGPRVQRARFGKKSALAAMLPELPLKGAPV